MHKAPEISEFGRAQTLALGFGDSALFGRATGLYQLLRS